MINFFCLIISLFFLALPVSAQMYDDKHEVLLNAMDRAAVQSNELYADVPLAGASEDAKSQEARYVEMTAPGNETNDRHFDESAKLSTITEDAQK